MHSVLGFVLLSLGAQIPGCSVSATQPKQEMCAGKVRVTCGSQRMNAVTSKMIPTANIFSPNKWPSICSD